MAVQPARLPRDFTEGDSRRTLAVTDQQRINTKMAKRLTALVIGNAAYTRITKLGNSVNDADDIGAKLAAHGFTVIKKTDCTHKEMDLALKEFRASLTDSDVALFFFAGHGM